MQYPTDLFLWMKYLIYKKQAAVTDRRCLFRYPAVISSKLQFKLPILIGHICTSFRYHNSSVLKVVYPS